MTSSQQPPFTRDRFTWVAYLLLGYFAYFLAAPGVAMPLLREDLNLNYTVGGLHVSAVALGMVGAGLLTEPLVGRFGRYAVYWGGGAGMALGVLLFVAGRQPALTLPAALVMGLAGTMLLVTIQATLSDRHGPLRALALTESNVVASATTILAPLLIGSFARTAAGWRLGFALPVLLWLAAYLIERGQPLPPAETERDDEASGRALPALFWLYWVALVLSVSVEWSLITWGADFLVVAGGLARANASLLMSAFFVAMLVGRLLGSALARQLAVARLLLLAMLVGLAGFLIFWLAPLRWLMIGGLFLAGLGVANLFPFMLSIAMGVVSGRAGLASSRVTLGTGSAILLAPLTLGWIADRAGIEAAYGLVAVLFTLALALVIITRWATRGRTEE